MLLCLLRSSFDYILDLLWLCLHPKLTNTLVLTLCVSGPLHHALNLVHAKILRALSV